MDINELVMHPIQLDSVEISEISVKKMTSGYLNESKCEIKISLHGEVDKEDKHKGFTYLRMKIKSKNKFEIDVTYKGICLIEEDVEELKFIRFLEAQSIKMLWAYMREAITDIMMKMDIKPIKFPTLDVIKSTEKLVDN